MSEESGKKSGCGVGWVFAGLVFVILVLSVIGPWYGRMTPRAYESMVLSNTRQVGYALKYYAIDHSKRFPDTLDALVEGLYFGDDDTILLESLRENRKYGQEGAIQFLTPGANPLELAPDTPILRVPWEGDRWIQVTADYAGSFVPRQNEKGASDDE